MAVPKFQTFSNWEDSYRKLANLPWLEVLNLSYKSTHISPSIVF